MIRPLLQHEAFLADIKVARQDELNLHLWWLGQSGFLVHWRNNFLLFDPYLSDSLTRKYQNTDKPHIRMTELVVDPSQLSFVQVVTSTHNHTDHLDAETLNALFKANPDIDLVIPEANREFVSERLNIVADIPVGLDAGRSAQVHGFKFHAVPAAHETIDRDPFGRCKYLGYIVEIGNWTLYHSGDTLVYEGMADLLKPFNIDIAMLPINGRAPERRVSGNMNGAEAAALAKAINCQVVIPCHYDMFTFNTANPKDFAAECERLGQACEVMQAGERLTFLP